jgi:hypothetical protein
MFWRCANPECSIGFDYHLGGKYFRFHQSPKVLNTERNTHEVVHFWLCGICVEKYTLDYDGSRCLLVENSLPPINRREATVIWHGEEESRQSTEVEPELTAVGGGAQPGGEKKVWA